MWQNYKHRNSMKLFDAIVNSLESFWLSTKRQGSVVRYGGAQIKRGKINASHYFFHPFMIFLTTKFQTRTATNITTYWLWERLSTRRFRAYSISAGTSFSWLWLKSCVKFKITVTHNLNMVLFSQYTEYFTVSLQCPKHNIKSTLRVT